MIKLTFPQTNLISGRSFGIKTVVSCSQPFANWLYASDDLYAWKLFDVYGLAVEIRYAMMSIEFNSGNDEISLVFSFSGTK